MFYVHWLRSLGPLPATYPPLRSDAQHLAPVDQPMRSILCAGTPWATRVVVCVLASPCCAASKSRSESPDILPGGSAGLHSGALTDSLNVSSAFTARCLRAETLAPQRLGRYLHPSITTGTTHGALERYKYRNPLRPDQPGGCPHAGASAGA